MKRISILFAMLFLAFGAFAAAPVKTISGNITGNVFWNFDTVYLLSGKVYVKAGATLTIAPGTIIKGDYSTAGSCLVITRGAKIMAEGEATRPIVFTSSRTVGNRATADWGGIVMEGNAKINVPGGIGTVEGGNLSNPDGTASDGQYGGLNDLDNSGVLKYVRIEFAGYPYAPNNELNGLTLAGVGSGTVLSHIQVSYGFDDAFEFFGGTVNADHLVSYRGNDDDFDTDFGFRGKVQFGVALRDTSVADAVSGANGFESDNDGTGTASGPKTSAVFSNMTLVGPRWTASNGYNSSFRSGAHIRRNSEQSIFNSIFMGWPTGVKIDGDSCHRNADSLWLAFQQNIVAGSSLSLDSVGPSATTWGISNWFNTMNTGNTLLAQSADVMLTTPHSYSAPDFRPATGSPALSGASFANAKLASGFDVTPTYRGAFGSENWMENWTSFTPDTNPYEEGVGPLGFTEEQRAALQIQLIPNPATDKCQLFFTLPQASNVTCELVDLSGHIVFHQQANFQVGQSNMSIPVSTLANGIYMVRLNVNGVSLHQKLNVIH